MYYVRCKAHRDERHFVRPEVDGAPAGREDFLDCFTISGYCECEYTREDVTALAAPDFSGPLRGAFLMFEPFVWLWWQATGKQRREDQKAAAFNAG